MMEASQRQRSKDSSWFSTKTLKLNFRRRGRRPTLRPGSGSPTSPGQVSGLKLIDRETELREIFLHFDGDGDGKISPLELSKYFASIGEYMSCEEARGVIRDLDSDGDNLLGYEDFVRVMRSEEGDEEDDLKKAFEMFELEKGEGFITPKGLQRMMHRLGDPKTLEECASMIRVFDIDGDGVVDFQEFHTMMLSP